MAVSEGKPTATDVKGKLQGVLKELETYQDLYRRTLQELESERELRIKGDAENVTLSRRMTLMEEGYEQLSIKLNIALEKLEEATKAADESERSRRTMDQRRTIDDDRIALLEQLVRETSEAATEFERKYDEVARKLLLTESELEKVESNTETAEMKAKHLQQDMHSLTNRLKSMAATIEKFTDREQKYNRTIEDLQARLKTTEIHSNDSDRTVQKLQNELDHLQDELINIKLKYQSLHDKVGHRYSHEISAI